MADDKKIVLDDKTKAKALKTLELLEASAQGITKATKGLATLDQGLENLDKALK